VSDIAASALMKGFPPVVGQRVTAANWQFPPFNRWAFSNARRILPTARVRRGVGVSQRFARPAGTLGELPVMLPGERAKPLTGVIEDTFTDGFLVLHRGRLVYEYYSGALCENATHMIWSVSKSVLSALIGILIERGMLDPSRPAGHYIPELRAAGYGGVTIDRLLDMRSGMKYSEDYTDPDSEFSQFDEVCGFRPRVRSHPAQGVYEYLAMLEVDPRDPGDFSYRSTDSDVLGWIAERTTGVPLESLLETELWVPLATEEDADLLVDPVGSPIADGGLCTTLRDLGRFAQMQLDGGTFNGRQVVPERWVAACCVGDRGAYARKGYTALFPRGAYARQWWIADTESKIRLALGIHGQMIYLDPHIGLACVKLSSAPTAIDPQMLDLTVRACAAIGTTLG
jgi:CubicO group peptidase (beta-lactamase class C family)